MQRLFGELHAAQARVQQAQARRIVVGLGQLGSQLVVCRQGLVALLAQLTELHLRDELFAGAEHGRAPSSLLPLDADTATAPGDGAPLLAQFSGRITEAARGTSGR